MNEKEAWLAIAREWKELVNSPQPNSEKIRIYSSGLCGSIIYRHNINIYTQVAMFEKISKHLKPGNMYLFLINTEGAKQRIEFCIARANELT